MLKRILLIIGCFAMNTFGADTKTAAYLNAKIYSGSELKKDSDAFLVRNGRFAALGSTQAIKQLIDNQTTVVDLGGALVMPGFIESHAHLVGLGKTKLMLDLKGLDTSKIVDLVKKQARQQPKNTWIKGRGWDQNLWADQRFPDKSLFSTIENPVYLVRVDGHAIWVNDTALKLAAVTDETKDPPGGQIVRDSSGKPTGVFVDTAIELISKHLASPSKSDLELYLGIGMKEAASFGITSFHDAGASADMLDLFEDYALNKKLTLRIYAMIDGEDRQLVEKFLNRGPVSINDTLTIRSIKYFADGALGSRGALLLEDYQDQPGHKGLSLIDKKTLFTNTEKALKRGFQVATHAIGDGANRLVLDAYEDALKTVTVADHRLRIEHAQLIHESDHHRFKTLGVIASMQPIHCTSDMTWVQKRLSPDRLTKRAYPWRSLLNQGALLAFGSDAPVESINPILGLHAAVTRSDPEGSPNGGFMPEEKLTLKEALNGYFSQAAFAEFNEGQKGQIKEGYLADFVVFDENLLHPIKSSFLNARPAITVMGGNMVYQREKTR
jgi:predicted amidohydrolase YtcJ